MTWGARVILHLLLREVPHVLTVVPPELSRSLTELASKRSTDKSPPSWLPVFQLLAQSEQFAAKVWEKEPLYAPGVRGPRLRSGDGVNVGEFQDLTIADLRFAAKAGQLERGRTMYFTESRDKSAFIVERASPGRIGLDDLENKLRIGSTFVVNIAAAIWPSVAHVVSDAIDAFGVPASANLYVARAGHPIAMPPHNDVQDTFILQVQGRKTWVLYRPPHAALPIDELGRGKGMDALREEELGKPIQEVTLREGDLLHVPRGIVHTTSIPAAAGRTDDDLYSVHLTLGLDIDTVQSIHSRAMLCAFTLSSQNSSDGEGLIPVFFQSVQKAEKIPANSALRASIPVGFLRSRPIQKAASRERRLARKHVFPLLPQQSIPQVANVLSQIACEQALNILVDESHEAAVEMKRLTRTCVTGRGCPSGPVDERIKPFLEITNKHAHRAMHRCGIQTERGGPGGEGTQEKEKKAEAKAKVKRSTRKAVEKGHHQEKLGGLERENAELREKVEKLEKQLEKQQQESVCKVDKKDHQSAGRRRVDVDRRVEKALRHAMRMSPSAPKLAELSVVKSITSLRHVLDNLAPPFERRGTAWQQGCEAAFNAFEAETTGFKRDVTRADWWVWSAVRTLAKDYGLALAANASVPLDANGQPLPMYTYPVIEYLDRLDLRFASVLEFGSGMSTLWWARRAKTVVAIEANDAWREHISKLAITAGERPGGDNVHVLPGRIRQTPCRPVDGKRQCSEREKAAHMSLDVASALEGTQWARQKFDFVVIDAATNRFALSVEAGRRISKKGVVILDNTEWYPRSALLLRASPPRGFGLLQVDFFGFKPTECFTAATSLFFTRGAATLASRRDGTWAWDTTSDMEHRRPVGGQKAVVGDGDPWDEAVGIGGWPEDTSKLPPL
eukprot:TRINITY_DN38103_c0_g1_i1.p1 TRINITY_DN38103_c0_g1~~TRINITY_DN38103_c0_g1_i1.p1  ORF type:complete len:901 (-),score=147.57 TRINITY_DN38103_c0_g1_i1:147-2849(-)